MNDPIADFRAAMISAGLIPPAEIVADGKLHRCAAEGRNGRSAGSYLLHLDGRPSGGFQNFKSGRGWETWTAAPERPLTRDEKAHSQTRIAAERAAREADDAARKAEAARKAAWIWDRATAADGHPYLLRKGIAANGVRQRHGNLVIPLREVAGALHSLQFIKPDGGKLFLTGGRKAGCFYAIGEIGADGTIVLAEGFATAASLHEATGLPTVTAFDCGNLEPVARALRGTYPAVRLILAADDDWRSPGNPGLTAAIEAARAVKGLVALPVFGADRPAAATDFNDMAASSGLAAVRRAIEAAGPPEAVREAGVKADAPAPQPAKPARPGGKRSPFRLEPGGVEKRVEVTDPDTGAVRQDWRWFCSPIAVTALTRDSRGEAWGRLLVVTDADGHEKSWAMPMAMLAGDGAGYREHLLSLGLVLAPSKFARDALHEYLSTSRPEARMRCVHRLGWHDGVFVMPAASFAPPAEGAREGIVLQGGGIDHAFNLAGEVEAWRRDVAALAVGNSRLLLAIGAAFAAPLLDLVGQEGGGIHLRGASSCGKTTALQVAGSVWGGGSKGYIRSWRLTDNALESTAALHCDALLCLDELAQVLPAAAAASAYMLSSGAGKARATRHGDARATAEWRTLFLSTGEISLADKIAEDGKGRHAMAGQQARIVDLAADAGAGIGVFETLHGFASGDALSRALKAAAASHYGHAARAFLAAITRDLDGVRRAVAAAQRDFVTEYCPAGADGQVQRVAARFGLVAAAGELAVSFGIVPWPEGAAIEGVARCWRDWLAERGGIGAEEDAEAVRTVRLFVETYGTSRFERMYDPDEDGSQQPSSERTVNRVGFRRVGKDKTDYYILPESWRAEVCRGLDAKRVAKTLVARGMLLPDQEGKSSRPMRMPGFDRPIRVYCLTQKLMD